MGVDNFLLPITVKIANRKIGLAVLVWIGKRQRPSRTLGSVWLKDVHHRLAAGIAGIMDEDRFQLAGFRRNSSGHGSGGPRSQRQAGNDPRPLFRRFRQPGGDARLSARRNRAFWMAADASQSKPVQPVLSCGWRS